MTSSYLGVIVVGVHKGSELFACLLLLRLENPMVYEPLTLRTNAFLQ